MGNCMAGQSQPKKQTRGPLIEGRETDVDALVKVEEKMNPASGKRYIVVHRKLHQGELDRFASLLKHSGVDSVPCRTTDIRNLKTKSVKIVVTTQQLELLLRGSNKFQTRRTRASSGLRRCPKWFPSLPTIQEVQSYWVMGCVAILSFPIISCATNLLRKLRMFTC